MLFFSDSSCLCSCFRPQRESEEAGVCVLFPSQLVPWICSTSSSAGGGDVVGLAGAQSLEVLGETDLVPEEATHLAMLPKMISVDA